MIKLKIEKYRDYTEEEKREEAQNRINRDWQISPNQDIRREYKHCEGILDVEITDAQFEAIRKAVIEKF